MSGIKFIVRDSAGSVQRGEVAGEGVSASVVANVGQDISLNLSRAQVQSYTRQGQALQVQLIDGRVILIEGYFTPEGIPQARLYLSSGGVLAEVELADAGEGYYYANYTEGEAFGKWSPDDDLFFLETSDVMMAAYAEVDNSGGDVGMLAAPFLAGIGGVGTTAAVGGALLGTAIIGSTGGGLEVAAETGVQATGDTVTSQTFDDGVQITGTGTPGGTVTVQVDGHTEQTIVGDDGKWSVVFEPGVVAEGEYEIEALIEIEKDGQTSSTIETIVVDTEAHVELLETSGGVDMVVNSQEFSGGVSLSGSVEEGSTVVVTVDGMAYEATVEGTTWSLDLPAGAVAEGEYDLAVSVEATDTYGNVTTTNDTIAIDTVTDVAMNTAAVGNGGTVNSFAHENGVTVTGAAQPGATVEVSIDDATQTVTANGNGAWTANFAKSDLAAGTYDATVTAVATDAAGNTATATGTISVDTEVLNFGFDAGKIEGDNVVNGDEERDGVTVGGTVEPGSSVEVTLAGVTKVVTAGADGNWSATYSASELPNGEYDATLTAKATDPAGNIQTISKTVTVDTLVNELTHNTVETDDTANGTEVRDGITLSGSVEPSSTVMVTFDGIERAATVAPDGSWTVNYAAGEIRGGEYTANVTVAATDANGNTKEISDTFQVDTVAPDAPLVTAVDIGRTQGLRAFAVDDNDTSFEVFRVDDNGSVNEIGVDAVQDLRFNEVDLYLDTNVADGNQLVLAATDDAGNEASTLFVLDEAGTDIVDVDNPGLNGFDIHSIDLQFAEDSELELSAADIASLTNGSNELTILGGTDDTVRLTGGQDTGTSRTVDGTTYNVYSLDDASVLVKDDITVVI